jgi:DNA-binding MarR family transcriptional regulator
MEKVHNTHILRKLPTLHRSLIEIVAMINEPERDAMLLDAAGLGLERALFPLLVLIERLGPIGVVELAGKVGRDYTTVSRQVARLEELGLVDRRKSPADSRKREATITRKGRAATDALDRARETMAIQLFADWGHDDFDELVRLLARLAKDMALLPDATP